ncbi:MAG: hypothetical protein MR531_06450 [Lachnospiraceae bacterium]|nr:hypothetical protein [Lachnospiraceae bacterium]
MMRGERPEGLPDGALPEGGMKPDAELPKDGIKPDRERPQGEIPTENGAQDITELDNIQRNATEGGLTISGSYETAQDYIDALNAENEWVTYDSATNTATITSVADFVKALKNASKNVGAFDDLDAIQGENVLFGYGDGNGAHFDPVMAELLADNESYGADVDFETVWGQGHVEAERTGNSTENFIAWINECLN